MNILFPGIRRYVRTIAINSEENKAELHEVKKLILKDKLSKFCSSTTSSTTENNDDFGPNGEQRHPVFKKTNYVTMPLTEITDFQDFEEQLKTPLIRNNLVCRIFLLVNFNVFQYFKLFHLIKIEAIRAMGGKDLGSIVRTAWRETMSDLERPDKNWFQQAAWSCITYK